MNATLEAIARALFKSWFVDFDPVRRNQDRNAQRAAATDSANRQSPANSADSTNHDLRNLSQDKSSANSHRASAANGDLAAHESAAKAANHEPAVVDSVSLTAIENRESLDAIFPAAFQDSALGEIPAGWSAKPLPDVVEVNPRRTLKAGTSAPYLDMKNLPTQGHSAEQVVDREFRSGTKFQNGDTLLARITPCLENGKTGYVDFLEPGQVGWGSTEYIILAPKSPLPPQLGYLLARSDALRMHAIQNMTGTSGRQRVPAECFNSFLIAVPSLEVARSFDELTVPLMVKIKANSIESRTLAALRDTLLPKLLSGELSVVGVEKEVLA